MPVIYQFGFNTQRRPPASVKTIDCRKFMRNCFSLEQARSNANFKMTVNMALDALKDNECIGIACSQGKHRSLAVAIEVARITGAKLIKLGR